MTTPDLRPHVHNCLLLEDRDDESVVDSPSCDGCECMDAASCVVTHGKGSQQPLQTAATSTAAAAAAATTTTAASVKNDGQQPPSNLVPTADLGSPSTSAFSMGELGEPNPTSREHSYDLRSRIPRPPNAFMLFAQEKRRLVAAQNPNENNQIVSTRLGKMWLALSVADKDLYRRKAALEATKHRKKYPDYVYNPLDARHRKEQERRAKQIAAKLMKGIEEPPAVTAKESGGASSHEQDKDSKEAGSATRRLTMQRRRRRAAAGGITRTRCATHTAPQQTRKTPKQTTTAARRRTAFVQAMATTSRPSAAFDEQRRLAAQSAQRRDATNGSAAPHASQFPAPATHQFDARMSLVSCGRDCAAVPCAQTHCPSTSCVAGDGTQPQGWLDFSTQASAASQMASGLATSPVLWLPLLTAAAAPAVAPSLSLLLPAEVAVHQTPAAVARPPLHIDAQPQHHAPARHDAVAGQMHLVVPLAQGHQAPTEAFHPTQHDPLSTGAATNPANGGAFAPMPGMAGHPHLAAMAQTAATAGGTSNAMMWSTSAGQPAQRQDARLQQEAYRRLNAADPTYPHDAASTAAAAASTHAYYGANATQPTVYQRPHTALTGFDAHPFGPLLSAATGGHAGGAVFLSPTALFSPVLAANQPRSMTAANQCSAGFLRQQPGLSMAGEQQLHSPLGADWPYQPGAWGGPFTSDDDFGMHPFLGRSNGQRNLF
ncbi:uncharacterized protein LOC144097122 isoform X1 [Amblyomma americanum]